jgi:hypothetical protein
MDVATTFAEASRSYDRFEETGEAGLAERSATLLRELLDASSHLPSAERGALVGLHARSLAAVSYTLLETAKLVGVDPAKYLREAALADARGEVLVPA